MRSLFPRLALVALLLAPVIAYAATTRTFQNVLIGTGTYFTPDVNVPKGSVYADVYLTRTNWPAQGVTLSIEFTYDGVSYVTVAGPYGIPQGGINPKTGTVDPASFGFGWVRNPQPKGARIKAINPGGNFRTDITVNTK